MLSTVVSNILGRVLVGFSIALTVLCLFFYFENKRLDTTIDGLTRSFSEVSNRNSVLEGQIKNCKTQFDAAMLAKEAQQEAIDQVLINENKTLEQIRDLIVKPTKEEKSENKTNSGVNNLRPDLIRLLSQHCRQVRGEDCPNP